MEITCLFGVWFHFLQLIGSNILSSLKEGTSLLCYLQIVSQPHEWHAAVIRLCRVDNQINFKFKEKQLVFFFLNSKSVENNIEFQNPQILFRATQCPIQLFWSRLWDSETTLSSTDIHCRACNISFHCRKCYKHQQECANEEFAIRETTKHYTNRNGECVFLSNGKQQLQVVQHKGGCCMNLSPSC